MTPEHEPSPVNSVWPATRPLAGDELTTRSNPPNWAVVVRSGATTL